MTPAEVRGCTPTEVACILGFDLEYDTPGGGRPVPLEDRPFTGGSEEIVAHDPRAPVPERTLRRVV